MSKRWILLAAFAGIAAVVPLLAWANHADVRDRNDTSGLLDVSRVEVTGSERPVWHILTFNDWTVERIFDTGFFLVRLDTFGTERYDYYALVRSDGDRLKGTLVRDRSRRPDFNVSRIEVWRPARNSVRVRIPLAKMRIGTGRLTYTWQVQTLFSSGNCRRVCIDDVPDQRGVSERLPGVPPSVPTATPTAGPTATPSPTTT